MVGMGDRGGLEESSRLKKTLDQQLARLAQQVEDLADARDDVEEEDYLEEMRSTLEQLNDFKRLAENDITLLSKAAALQHQIQDAVRSNRDMGAVERFSRIDEAIVKEKEKQSDARNDSIRNKMVSVSAGVNIKILEAPMK